MKKYMTVLVIAAAMTACNGSGGSSTKVDSAVSNATIDSAAMKVDSTIKAAADTAKVKIGNTVDSARKAIRK